MNTLAAHPTAAPLAAAQVDPIYAEALKLADAARGYFDGAGIAERAALDGSARTATANESLRITARLIAIVSWGLQQQAIRNGEVGAAQARGLGAPDPEAVLTMLPPRARALAVASRDLFARACAADAAIAA
jgi:regulator of CtrA degradation